MAVTATPRRNLPTYHLGTTRVKGSNNLWAAVLDANDKPVYWSMHIASCLKFLSDQIKHGKCHCEGVDV